MEGKVQTIDGVDVDISRADRSAATATRRARSDIVEAVREALDKAGCQVKPLRDWLARSIMGGPERAPHTPHAPRAPAEPSRSASVQSDQTKRRTLQIGTGRASPFSVSGPRFSASMMVSTADATRAEIRICPPSASPQSRAARFVTLPIAP